MAFPNNTAAPEVTIEQVHKRGNSQVYKRGDGQVHKRVIVPSDFCTMGVEESTVVQIVVCKQFSIQISINMPYYGKACTTDRNA